MHGFSKHLLHFFSHASTHAKKEGDTTKATGFALMGLGTLCMPIPAIGVPLVLLGAASCLKKKPEDGGAAAAAKH